MDADDISVPNRLKEEYEYLEQEYPQHKFIQQALIKVGDIHMDVLTIETVDGEQKEIYFDISSFYGNYQKMFEEAIKKEDAPDKN